MYCSWLKANIIWNYEFQKLWNNIGRSTVVKRVVDSIYSFSVSTKIFYILSIVSSNVFVLAILPKGDMVETLSCN